MKAIKVGLIGLGTVGCACVDVLQKNGQEISRRAGRKIEVISAAVRDIHKHRNCDVTGITLTQYPEEIIQNSDVDVVVELMGGTTKSVELVAKAIENKKHVVTANKALLATHGNEIIESAYENGVTIAFEAAVAGGIPIIKALREGLVANQITGVTGILNGTSNYILTEMQEKGASFEHALQRAQQLGFAEADPSLDIDGGDIAHKLTILATIAFGIPLQLHNVYVEGIANITTEDIIYADELGYCIKQLGVVNKTEKGIELRVHPTLVRNKRLMANVLWEMNAVLVHGDRVGPTIYYGPGAGGNATASSVVADLVDIARSMTVPPENRVPYLAFQRDAIEDLPIVNIKDVYCANYLRLHAEDRTGVMAEMTRILASCDISIEAIIQKEPVGGSRYVPIVILTHRVNEENMSSAVRQLEVLDYFEGKIMRIRLDQ